MKNLALTVILFFCIATTYANSGDKEIAGKTIVPQTIEGKIIDSSTNEALAGVAVKINGSDKKYYTDFEGNFVINDVAPGTYNIDVLYVSYTGITLEGITTKESGIKLKVELESVSH